MSDLKKYVVERKRRDRDFADGFEEGCAPPLRRWLRLWESVFR
jgi:hypothetical protein